MYEGTPQGGLVPELELDRWGAILTEVIGMGKSEGMCRWRGFRQREGKNFTAVLRFYTMHTPLSF